MGQSKLSNRFPGPRQNHDGSYPSLARTTCQLTGLAEHDDTAFVLDDRIGMNAATQIPEPLSGSGSFRIWSCGRHKAVHEESNSCDAFQIGKQGYVFKEAFIAFFPRDECDVSSCFIAMNAGDIKSGSPMDFGFVHFCSKVKHLFGY